MFRVAGHFFFTRDALKHGSSYQGQKSYRNDPEGKQKLLRVRGRFDLSRAQVTEGKITVNVRKRNPGEIDYGSSKRGFESSRVNCIRYLWHCNIPQNTTLHYITSSAPFFKASLVNGPGPATANPLSSGPQLFE